MKSFAEQQERKTERRSPCGERGLKCLYPAAGVLDVVRRSPCGERGLKLPFGAAPSCAAASLPVRGAWIEMMAALPPVKMPLSRSPCGERGLKYIADFQRPAKIVAPRAGSVD